MSPFVSLPLQVAGAIVFRLFGLLFAALGLLNLLRSREVTAHAIRRRADGAVDEDLLDL